MIICLHGINWGEVLNAEAGIARCEMIILARVEHSSMTRIQINTCSYTLILVVNSCHHTTNSLLMLMLSFSILCHCFSFIPIDAHLS